MSRKKRIDAKDVEILNILQTEGKITNKELSGRIGLSESPTFTRVENLVKNGLIKDTYTEVDLKQFGYEFYSLVEFNIPRDSQEDFSEALLKLPSVLTSYMYLRKEGLLREKRTYIHATFAHKSQEEFIDEMKMFLLELNIPVDYRVYELEKVLKSFPVVNIQAE